MIFIPVAEAQLQEKFFMLRDISWRYFDFWLLGTVVLATAFGTTMIRSAVAGNEVLLPLINRQIYFALVGLVLIFIVATIDYRYWMALYRPIFIVMSLLLFFTVPERAGSVWRGSLVSSGCVVPAADRVCEDRGDIVAGALF